MTSELLSKIKEGPFIGPKPGSAEFDALIGKKNGKVSKFDFQSCDCGWGSDSRTLYRKCPKCGAKYGGLWIERRFKYDDD